MSNLFGGGFPSPDMSPQEQQRKRLLNAMKASQGRAGPGMGQFKLGGQGGRPLPLLGFNPGRSQHQQGVGGVAPNSASQGHAEPGVGATIGAGGGGGSLPDGSATPSNPGMVADTQQSMTNAGLDPSTVIYSPAAGNISSGGSDPSLAMTVNGPGTQLDYASQQDGMDPWLAAALAAQQGAQQNPWYGQQSRRMGA